MFDNSSSTSSQDDDLDGQPYEQQNSMTAMPESMTSRMSPAEIECVLKAKAKRAQDVARSAAHAPQRESVAGNRTHESQKNRGTVGNDISKPPESNAAPSVKATASAAPAPHVPTSASSAETEAPATPPAIHPLAALFPLMDDAELENMAQDIATNGLQQPIVLWHGSVIDGQNRLRACSMAGIQPRYTNRDDLSEDTIYQYVISTNVRRRHLTTSQREMIAANLVTMKPGYTPPQEQTNTANCGISRSQAAAMMNVSESGLERARTVMAKDPALATAVRQGVSIDGKHLTTSGALKRIKDQQVARAADRPTTADNAPPGQDMVADARRKEANAVIAAVGGFAKAWEQVKSMTEALHDDTVQAGYVRMIERLGADGVLDPNLLLAPLRAWAAQPDTRN